MIKQTTRGDLDENLMVRIVGLEDRPDLYVIWVKYELDGEVVRQESYRVDKFTGEHLETIRGFEPVSGLKRILELVDGPLDIALATVYRDAITDELVKRSVHVILKEPSVVADALAGSF